jgi:hypothetical protein
MSAFFETNMKTLVETRQFVGHRYQAITSLTLLALLVGICLATDLLARSRHLEQLLMSISTQLAKKNNTLFSNTGNFIDFEERVLLDEIPRADYSRGGVYFFGTSNMKWAFTTWDLPEDQRRLIGNYGIGASGHTTHLRLIQYLAEQRGFLEAGDRTLVIFGVTFPLGRKDDLSTGFFVSLLRRHGLYTSMPDGRIVPVPMVDVERWLRVEKARSSGFIWNLGRLARGWAATLVRSPRHPVGDGAYYRQAYTGFMEAMGPDWQQNMDDQLERLKETIYLLRSHKVQVKVMLLPEATWANGLPFKSRYDAKIRALCQSTSTPLVDFSHAMPDDAFVDSGHLTVDGQTEFRSLIMAEISEHLHKLQEMQSSHLVGQSLSPTSMGTTR